MFGPIRFLDRLGWLSLYPRRKVAPARALASAENDGSAFASNGPHERQPCVPGVRSWRKVEIDVLRIQRVSEFRLSLSLFCLS